MLWLTDDRALNAQTIGKILQSSGGRIDANRIRFLADTDARTLEPGYVYFVHIQALQKNSTLHAVRVDGTKNDRRTFGAWDMIANTAKRPRRGLPGRLGRSPPRVGQHRRPTAGPSPAPSSTAGCATSADPAAGGADGPRHLGDPRPVPEAAMSASGRTMRTVDVPPGDVRESGLLKDRILIKHIAEDAERPTTRCSPWPWRT